MGRKWLGTGGGNPPTSYKRIDVWVSWCDGGGNPIPGAGTHGDTDWWWDNRDHFVHNYTVIAQP